MYEYLKQANFKIAHVPVEDVLPLCAAIIMVKVVIEKVLGHLRWMPCLCWTGSSFLISFLSCFGGRKASGTS
jgi:hypothetical protein